MVDAFGHLIDENYVLLYDPACSYCLKHGIEEGTYGDHRPWGWLP